MLVDGEEVGLGQLTEFRMEGDENANIAGFVSKYGGFAQVDEYCCECKECRERASLDNVLHVVIGNEIFET